MKKDIFKYLNESPTLFFILKNSGKSWDLEYVTPNVKKYYGYEDRDFLSKKIKHEDFIHPEDLENYKKEQKIVSKTIQDEYTYKPYRLINKDRIIWINHIIKIMRNEETGLAEEYFGYLTEITQLQNARKSLNQYFNIINENVLISITDFNGNIIDASEAYCRLTGFVKSELIGLTHKVFRHPSNDNEFFKDLWDTVKKGLIWKGEHLNIKKDGTEFWVENSITPNYDDNQQIIGFTSVYNDITDKKRIIELSITDHLTMLYNRRYFNQIFEMELKRAKRDKTSFILMILDIDFFKQYNDTYGHQEGDYVLKNVSKAIKDNLRRPQDFAFRIGGEEFAIITSNIDKEGILKLVETIIKSIEDLKIEHKGSMIKDIISISMGIKYLEAGNDLDEKEIFKWADTSLYEAKALGRDCFILF